MARLSKKDLVEVFEASIRQTGMDFVPLSTGHPADYSVYGREGRHRLRIYIWNLTPGGQNRPRDEWRIQITGVDRFEEPPGFRTLILGWEDDRRVFAGFDVRRHARALGSSPSLQLREAALDKARANGLAPHNKGSGELAIAFRPDLVGIYIDNLRHLHDCGKNTAESALLDRIGEEPKNVDDKDIADNAEEQRQYALVTTLRAIRDIEFRSRVLQAYQHRCAFCGIQLDLLDAGHILPVAHPKGTDKTSNGLALCCLHHRAYDRALITFGHDLRVHISAKNIRRLAAEGLDGGMGTFRGALLPRIAIPESARDQPDKRLIKTANEIRGWDF